ncbi:MAG: zf-HC2 domain-containing protein, partial [Planctomycetota bacterium]
MPSGEFRAVSGEESRCDALAESLSAYVDGALAETPRQEVEAHVRACTTCAAELARIQRLCADLRDLVNVQPPALVWDKVRDAAAGPAASGTRERSRTAAAIAHVLLFLFDGDLARRCRVEGTCREKAGAEHGVIALVAGLLLGLLAQGLTAATPVLPLAAGVLLAWLASTRLEGRLSHTGLVATLLAGTAFPGAWELARAAAEGSVAPMALPAAIAALAAAQAVILPRLRPQVLGRLRVPCVVRSCAVVLLAGALARPDLVGPVAAV